MLEYLIPNEPARFTFWTTMVCYHCTFRITWM